MGLIIKLAYRNLFRHRGKSLIIGVIMTLAAFVMTVSKASVNGIAQDFYHNVARSFTGELMVVSSNRFEKNILFDNSNESLPPIAKISQVKRLLSEQGEVLGILPMGFGMLSLLDFFDENFITFVLGVDFMEYQRFFNSNVIVLEGRPFLNGERGFLMTAKMRDIIYRWSGQWMLPTGVGFDETRFLEAGFTNTKTPNIKNDLVVLGIGSEIGKDIRLNISATIRHKDYNHFWGYFCIMDIESFRECFNLISQSDKDIALTADKAELFGMESENIEDLFGRDTELSKPVSAVQNSTTLETHDKEESYNLISVKLKEGADIDKTITKLNELFISNSADAQAIYWGQTISQAYDGNIMMRSILSGFVLFLYIVVIIVMMNTLNMAVIERTPEIAMMRSIGAQKHIIGGMFYAETLILSIIFGIIGIVLGVLAVVFLQNANIGSSDSELMAVFLGSDVFKPRLDNLQIITGFFEMLFFTSLSVLYPIRLSYKIQPIEAISRH